MLFTTVACLSQVPERLFYFIIEFRHLPRHQHHESSSSGSRGGDGGFVPLIVAIVANLVVSSDKFNDLLNLIGRLHRLTHTHTDTHMLTHTRLLAECTTRAAPAFSSSPLFALLFSASLAFFNDLIYVRNRFHLPCLLF